MPADILMDMCQALGVIPNVDVLGRKATSEYRIEDWVKPLYTTPLGFDQRKFHITWEFEGEGGVSVFQTANLGLSSRIV